MTVCMNDASKSKCFVTYETRFRGRLNATAGLAVLIASLGKHMPNIPLFILHTKPCDHLKYFADEFGPPCVFEKVRETEYYSWFGKPNAILSMLDLGYDRVCWLDADILFTRDCSGMLFPQESFVLRTTQAPNTPRCVPERHVALFGKGAPFDLDTSISSGVVSITPHHRELIEKWSYLMRNNLNFVNENNALFIGDQEFLEAAIMNMNRGEAVIRPILNDVDHLTCDRSIGIRKSLRLMFSSPPPIVHSTPYKAWWPLNRPFAHGVRSFLDCTPYTIEARRYGHAIRNLGNHVFIEWMSPSTFRSRICLSLPPWTFASPLFWYFVSSKLFSESYEPPEAERQLAMALEAERSGVPQE